MLKNTNNSSAEQLKSTKKALKMVIKESQRLASAFSLLEKYAGDGMCALDGRTLSECRAMMESMGRLLSREQGSLEYEITMADGRAQVEAVYSRVRRAAL